MAPSDGSFDGSFGRLFRGCFEGSFSWLFPHDSFRIHLLRPFYESSYLFFPYLLDDVDLRFFYHVLLSDGIHSFMSSYFLPFGGLYCTMERRPLIG